MKIHINLKNILLIILITANSILSQAYKPTEQSSYDLDFNLWFKGVRYATVYFEPTQQNKIDNGTFNDITNVFLEYLKELGFENVAITSEEKELLGQKAASVCDVTMVNFYADVEKKYIRNISIQFFTCDNNYFIFTSPHRIVADDNLDQNLKNEWKKMIGKKPEYQKSLRLKLPKRISEWTEKKLLEHYNKNKINFLEGIYEKMHLKKDDWIQARYKIGIIRSSDNDFDVIYLNGADNKDDWEEGEIKAIISKTAIPNFYKVTWLMSNKSENKDVYCTIDETNLLNFVFPKAKGNVEQKSKFLKLYPTSQSDKSSNIKNSATAFAISLDGYIVTSQHVVNGANSIKVTGLNGNFFDKYNVKIVIEDKNNDLAILKIEDESLNIIGTIPFTIKTGLSNVGEEVFALGYPLTTTMGEEIKLTDGIISSKSGFQGDVTIYQISVPVHPGNSGGPLFDKKGNLIGVISAKHKGAENVSYAVKSSYLMNLIASLPTPPKLSSKNLLSGKSLTEQVKILSKFVYIIEVN